MNFKKTVLASSISLMLLGLSGCGDSDSQDVAKDEATSFTGLVVDGRIARGFVWVDTDKDGVIDTYEPYAYTDRNGYFTYNPETGVNYCEQEDSDYCLETGMVEGDFQIKIAGGTDLSTGEPFEGVMTLNFNTDAAKEVEQQIAETVGAQEAKPEFIPVVSPLSSMILPNATAEEKARVLTKLGISGVTADNVDALLNMDFTAYSETGLEPEDYRKAELFFAAVKNQKQLEMLTALIDYYLELGGIDLGQDDDGNPGIGSTADLVTQLMAEGLAEDDASGKFSNVKSASIQLFNSIVQQLVVSRFDAPVRIVADNNSSVSDSIVETSSILEAPPQFSSGVPVFEPINTNVNLIDVASKLQTNVMLDPNLIVDSPTALDSINQNRNELVEIQIPLGSVIRNLVVQQKAEIKGVGSINLDINKVSNDVSDAIKNNTNQGDINSALENIVNDAVLPDVGTEAENSLWANRILSISANSDDGGDKGRAIFFFSADADTDTEGNVTLCYAFDAARDADDIEPTLVKATWSELASYRGQIDINHELVAFKIKARKRELASETDALNSATFRFISDEVDESWHSDFPVLDMANKSDWGLAPSSAASSVPQTAADCAALEIQYEGRTVRMTDGLTL